MQDWLTGRADTPLGRLALQWFRAYFAASRNSGCAATIYSTLSVLPAALVAVALFQSSGSDTNAFVERLITHLKLTGSTAIARPRTASAAPRRTSSQRPFVLLFSALLWGIGIGQIYQSVYARAWGIEMGSAADQALFRDLLLRPSLGAIALGGSSPAAQLRDTGWVCAGSPAWLAARRCRLWVLRFLLHRRVSLVSLSAPRSLCSQLSSWVGRLLPHRSSWPADRGRRREGIRIVRGLRSR